MVVLGRPNLKPGRKTTNIYPIIHWDKKGHGMPCPEVHWILRCGACVIFILQCVFCLDSDGGESFRLINREVCQYFSIQLNTRDLQAVHEL